MMRGFIITVALLLSACTGVPKQNAAERAEEFYSTYLTFFAESDGEYPQLREYVAAGTLSRLNEIESIPEQEIVGSDYFAYVQDYDPSWVKGLEVGVAHQFMNGEVLPVRIGIENGGFLNLEVYMRLEDGKWKIYRVRDVTDSYEHPIFNAGAITQAKASAESGL
ncbi:YbjP/YqhG family protein [Enterobacter chuandaensis]|uniref:DUF3828 domain-containing protein n=1 Tax=Enterobacter chuandaensis TaxID=2497875 RepID=UPI001FCB1F3F|nr:DUF3828 domain-containing protein [Enterobacter chuandaensis]